MFVAGVTVLLEDLSNYKEKSVSTQPLTSVVNQQMPQLCSHSTVVHHLMPIAQITLAIVLHLY